MALIQITVRNRIAEVRGSPHVVTGNENAYTVEFDFDSEWENQDTEHLIMWVRFQWNGKYLLYGTDFDTLTEATLPRLPKVQEIEIGVESTKDGLNTTTPARLPCVQCITDIDAKQCSPQQADLFCGMLQRVNAYLSGR